MKITAIKAQLKNAERVSVFVDDQYLFSLNHNQLLDQKIYSGLEISPARLEELKKASDFGKTFDRMLNYVMIRPRSVWEMQQYCRRKQYNAEDGQVIIDKFLARRYLSDEAFAKSWVENRRLNKAVSLRRIQMELKQKGVAEDIIQKVLGQSQYDEDTALRQVIMKKQRQAKYQDSQKLIQYLVRQGFSYDQVKSQLANKQ